MKKLLVAILALTTASASFADGHSMVRLDGCFDNGQCDNLNLLMESDTIESTDADDDTANTAFAFNYAMAFAGNYGAGITYKSMNKTTDGDVAAVGDKSSTIGLSFYWNQAGAWSDSCFAALHYNMTTNDDNDTTDDSGNKQTDIVLEFGHRYKIGTFSGLTMNWSPSATYTMGTTAYNNDDADDDKQTELAINFANLAVVF